MVDSKSWGCAVDHPRAGWNPTYFEISLLRLTNHAFQLTFTRFRMKNIYLSAIFALVAITGRAQNAADFTAEVPAAYFAFQLELIKETPGFSPPVASRSLSYTGLSAYEAVVHGIPNRGSFSGVLAQLEDLPAPDETAVLYWPEVMSRVLHNITAALYANMTAERLSELGDIRDNFTNDHAAEAGFSLAASQAFADDLSAALIDYAGADGQLDCQFSNFSPDYEPPVGEGLWAPLEGQQALQPYWGDKRCFVVEFVEEDLLAPAPPAFSAEFGSELYEEALAVYNATMELTQEEINIAEYWADGPGTVTPPGHSISMLTQILEAENSDLAFAAEAYARMGMAVADAFVQCWKTKYVHNLERPITYIRSHIDPEWNTLIETPPFPEYTSGHSSQSGAFGVIMTDLFGDDYAFTDHTHGTEFGGPRSFDNFVQCAEETAISRLYGGIHFPIGNQMGSESGIIIGTMVNDLFEEIVLSTDQTIVRNHFDIFPNPTTGQVRIEGDFSADYSVEVFDLAGKIIYRSAFMSNLDLGSLDAGLYLVSVSDRGGEQRGVQRLVIQ